MLFQCPNQEGGHLIVGGLEGEHLRPFLLDYGAYLLVQTVRCGLGDDGLAGQCQTPAAPATRATGREWKQQKQQQ